MLLVFLVGLYEPRLDFQPLFQKMSPPLQCSKLGKNPGCLNGKCRTISGNWPFIFLKTGCPNEILVASGNRATANFKHCVISPNAGVECRPEPREWQKSSLALAILFHRHFSSLSGRCATRNMTIFLATGNQTVNLQVHLWGVAF